MIIALKGLSIFLFALWPMVAITSVMMLGGPGATNDKRSIRDVILILYYPVLIAGIYWVAGATLLGVGGTYLFFISAIIITLSLRKFGYFKLAGNVMRGINNEGYSVVGDRVYYDAKHISGADAETFRPAEEATYSLRQVEYYLDKHGVYYRGTLVPGVDPCNFRRIKDKNSYGWRDYWRDSAVVVYDGEVLPNSDPDDFEVLDDSYTKSNNNIYHFANKINNADAATFEVITSFLAKDKNRVYCRHTAILPEADSATFKLVDPANSTSVAMDKDHVYFIFTESGSHLLEGVDVESVRVLDGGTYLKDRSAAYQLNDREVSYVPEADPARFRTVRYSDETPYHATDDVHYWLNGELIKSEAEEPI